MSMNNPAGSGATPDTGQQPGANQQPTSQGPNDPIQPPASGGQASATGGQQDDPTDRRLSNLEAALRRMGDERDAARRELEEERRKGLSPEEKARLQDLDKTVEAQRGREKNLVLRYEIASRAPKLGIVDPEIAVLLLSQGSSVTVNDDLTVTGLDQALKDLIKERPHLVARAPSTGDVGAGAGSTGGRTGAKPGMNDIIRDTVRGRTK